MDGTQDNMYVPVLQHQPYYFPCMDGTQNCIYVPARISTMQMGNNIGSTSQTQSEMVNNVSRQSSIVPSKFVDLNIEANLNVPFFFLVSQY